MIVGGMADRLRRRCGVERLIIAAGLPLAQQRFGEPQGVGRQGRDLFRQRERFVQQAVMRDDPADEAPFCGRRGIDHVTGEKQLCRPAHADRPGKQPGTPVAGHEAQLQEGDPELGLV